MNNFTTGKYLGGNSVVRHLRFWEPMTALTLTVKLSLPMMCNISANLLPSKE